MGPKRREALRKRFGSFKAIKQASEADLAAVVPASAARALWLAFHPPEDPQAANPAPECALASEDPQN